MTIWLITLLLLPSIAAIGYQQGAIRAGFSFFGIVDVLSILPFYAGILGSSVHFGRDVLDNSNIAPAEVDFYAGYKPVVGPVTFDIVRRVRLRQSDPGRWFGHRSRAPKYTNARSSSGRTGRGTTCWFGVGAGRSSRSAGSDALMTRYRASTVPARE